MKRLWKPVLVILIVFLFCQPVLADPAYKIKEGRRYYQSPLLTAFQNWSEADVKLASQSHPGSSDPAAADHDPAIAAGKLLWERHGATLEVRLNRFEEFVMAPLPRHTPEQLEALRVDTPVPDFHYSRSFTRGIVAMAAYLHSTGKHRTAVRLLLAGVRAGQVFAAGDGDVPPLITGMIGIAMQRTCLNPLFWKILEDGKLTAAEYRELAGIIGRMVEEQIAFKTWLEVEHGFARNVINNNLFSDNGPSLGEMLGGGKSDITAFFAAIPVGMKNQARQHILEKFNDLYRRQQEMLQLHGNNPAEFRRVMKVMSDELQAKANPSISKIFSPIDALGDILVSIVVPNWNRALERYQEMQLQLQGNRLLCLALAAEADRGSFPVDLMELARSAGGNLPVDWFGGQALHYRCGTEAVLWSVGENLVDDDGENGKDLILFRVSPRSEISLSRALWLDISEGKTEQAIPLYRALLLSPDPAVRAKARERLQALGGLETDSFPLVCSGRISPVIALCFPDPQAQKKADEFLQGFFRSWFGQEQLPGVKAITVVLRKDELKPENLDLVLEFDTPLESGVTPQPAARFAGSLPLTHSFRLADDRLILTELTSETALRNAYTRLPGDAPDWPIDLLPAADQAAFLELRDMRSLVDRNRIVPMASWPFREGKFTVALDARGLTASPWPDDTRETLLGILRGLAASTGTEFHGQLRGDTLTVPLSDLHGPLQSHFAILPGSFALAEARAGYRACMANVKVLEGATEMYRMDHSLTDDATVPVDLLQQLVKDNYLLQEPSCLRQCQYRFQDGHWSGSICGSPWIALQIRAAGGDEVQKKTLQMGEWVRLTVADQAVRICLEKEDLDDYRRGGFTLKSQGQMKTLKMDSRQEQWLVLPGTAPALEVRVDY